MKVAFKEKKENFLKFYFNKIIIKYKYIVWIFPGAASMSFQTSQPRRASFMKHEQNKFLCKNILHLI